MKMNAESLLTGAGLVVGAALLTPVLKRVAKPVVVTGVTGATIAGNEARKRFSFVREELEDFMAEVQFERFKQRLDKEMGSE